MKTKNNYQISGFTLIELIVVIFTLAIIASLSMPKIATLNSIEHDFSLYETLSAVRYAQRFSIAGGCDTKISLNAKIITINRRVSCTTGDFTTNLINPVDGSNSYTVEIPSNIAISANDLPIYFDKSGRAFSDLDEGGGDDEDLSNAIITIGSKNLYIIGETGFSYVE